MNQHILYTGNYYNINFCLIQPWERNNISIWIMNTLALSLSLFLSPSFLPFFGVIQCFSICFCFLLWFCEWEVWLNRTKMQFSHFLDFLISIDCVKDSFRLHKRIHLTSMRKSVLQMFWNEFRRLFSKSTFCSSIFF